MSQISINTATVDDIVHKAWNNVIKKIENGHPLSSEKNLIFLFAIALFEIVGSSVIVDFESQCYDDLDGESKYLDLLFYNDNAFKVAVEFKLPKRSKNGGSNQTQTRQAIYRDIARLNYLKNDLFVNGACYFLMGVNEDAYLNKGNYIYNVDYQVHHEHYVDSNNMLTVSKLSLTGCDFKFNWKMIKPLLGGKYVRDGQYAWLDPIKV